MPHIPHSVIRLFTSQPLVHATEFHNLCWWIVSCRYTSLPFYHPGCILSATARQSWGMRLDDRIYITRHAVCKYWLACYRHCRTWQITHFLLLSFFHCQPVTLAQQPWILRIILGCSGPEKMIYYNFFSMTLDVSHNGGALEPDGVNHRWSYRRSSPANCIHEHLGCIYDCGCAPILTEEIGISSSSVKDSSLYDSWMLMLK